MNFLISASAGLFLGAAWLSPLSILGAIFSLLACLTLAHLYYQKASLKFHFLTGFLAIGIAFYWLVKTISDFGGYPIWLSIPIYLLFAAFSSIQFILAAYLFRFVKLPLQLSGPICLMLTTSLVPRIFPWHFAHSLIATPQLTQLAEYGGAEFLSFLILWFSFCVTAIFSVGFSKKLILIPAFILSLSLMTFYIKDNHLKVKTNTTNIKLIQANISIEEKHNVKQFKKNTERYFELSKQNSETRPDLIIWPESVFLDWIYVSTKNINEDPRIPYFGPDSDLLFGALSFQNQDNIYNSIFAVRKDGSLSQPYHKQILMPFGEYMPFGDVFPALYELNPSAGHFTPGTEVELIEIHGTQKNPELNYKLASLICYEDLLPEIAARASSLGAELLVNHTNDAWFGNTLAPFQHHQIAAFRAIENDRYLIRSTNSGLTGIVDNFGNTVGELPVFSDGVLDFEVPLLNKKTIYSTWGRIGYQVAILILALIGIINFKRAQSLN